MRLTVPTAEVLNTQEVLEYCRRRRRSRTFAAISPLHMQIACATYAVRCAMSGSRIDAPWTDAGARVNARAGGGCAHAAILARIILALRWCGVGPIARGAHAV